MPRNPYDYASDPYSDRIGELIRARGDIAARQSLESGDIWGRGIQNIAGQLAGGVQQYAQQREQQRKAEELSKRDTVWTSYINSGEWRKDPTKAVGIAKNIWGPDWQTHFGALKAADDLIQSVGGKKDPKQVMENLGAVAAGYRDLDSDAGRDIMYPAVRALAMQNTPDLNMPETRDPTFDPIIGQFADKFGPKKEKTPTREIKVRLPDGTEETRIVPDVPATFTSAAPEGKKHLVTVAGPGGVPVQKLVTEQELATGVPGYVQPQVDVEGRQIRAEERKAEAEKTKKKEESIAAAKEADSQVDSAFSAMDTALKNLEKYSGTSAVTSPLEAANARQQYEDATKAFAATLARATGDNRISDLDRKAYADLVAYTGGGSAFLNIAKPKFARNRFEQAKKFFQAASKTRQGGGGKSRQVGRFTVEEE